MTTRLCLFVAACVLAVSPVRATDDKPQERSVTELKPAGGLRRPPSPEEVEAMLDVLREMEPDLADDIDTWRKDNPERITEIVNRRFPRLRHMVDAKRNDPELYALRISDFRLSRQSLELVRSYRAAQLAKDDKTDAIRNDLRESLMKQFEVRQQIRQRELQRMEQRIAQLRKDLDARAASKDRVLEDELKKLLEEREVKVKVEAATP